MPQAKVLVEFIRPRPPYMIGETAGFDADDPRMDFWMDRSDPYCRIVGEVEPSGETPHELLKKEAVHKGFGKWYVMQGNDQVSGPHKRDEIEEMGFDTKKKEVKADAET